ncbi:hypothetical protein BD309DRAFT_682107 [Dichomitus squalens]|nr:hypothetical protein BD309DRAFT_682107 [Dichomitus squalens]
MPPKSSSRHEIHHADSPYTTNDPASQLSQSSQWSQTTQSRALRKEGSGGGAWNVPVAHITMTETSGQTYGFALKTSEDRYIRLADEANRWILGPMPPMAFIDEFLSLDEVGVKGYMPSPAGAFDAVPTEGAKEEDFYEPLARAINAAGRCPGFTFCDTHLHEDTSDPSEGKAGHVKPDVCGYANEHLDRIETPALKQARTRGTGYAEGGPNGASITEDQGDSPASGMRRSARGGARSGSSKRGRVVHTGPHERGSAGGDGRLPEWESHGVRLPVPASAPANQPVTVPVKRTDMGYAALVVEVKATSHEDVFCDPSSPDSDRNKWSFISQSNSKEARRRLGQIVAYASETCKRQHRHCCFSISMTGQFIRLIRWDRAGAIVSERFNVREKPELLCEFLWRFASASHTTRGYDLTVEPATPEQVTEFRSAVEKHIAQQGVISRNFYARDALKEHFDEQSVTAIHLPDSPYFEQDGHYLLVSRPMSVPLSVTGRGTRTYWAVDSRTKQVQLLKDTWRYDVGQYRQETEGQILRALSAITKHVPPVMHEEDVLKSVVVADDLQDGQLLEIQYTSGDVQTTLTQDYLECPWVCRGGRTLGRMKQLVIRRIHHRLVLGAAGYPLQRFRHSEELLHGAYDALKALKSAYDVEKRLHRDITPGNIILYRDIDSESESEKRISKRCRRGYLIDWELSRKCEHGSSHSTNVEDLPVSATWQFLSATVATQLRRTTMTMTHIDDIESLIYVVLYCALLWLPFDDPSDQNLPYRIDNALLMFDYWHRYADGSAPSGGLHKTANLQDRIYTGSLEWATPTIQQWISQALDHCTRRSRSHVSTPEAFYDWYGKFLEAQQGSEISERNDNTKVEAIKHVFKSKKPLTALNKPVHQSTTPAASSSASRTINKRPLEDDTEISSTGNSDGPPAPKRARKGGETFLRPPAWNYHSYRSASHTVSSSTSLTVPGGDASISGDDMDDYSPYGVAASSSRDLGIEWDGTL